MSESPFQRSRLTSEMIAHKAPRQQANKRSSAGAKYPHSLNQRTTPAVGKASDAMFHLALGGTVNM